MVSKDDVISELEVIIAQEEYSEWYDKHIENNTRLKERVKLHKEIVELSRKPRYTIAEEAEKLHQENFVSVDYSSLDSMVMWTYGFLMAMCVLIGMTFWLAMMLTAPDL